MTEIQRYSSRLQRLDRSFLSQRLRHARSYDRIAGYFNASLLELVGEELESITGPIRVVCNSAVQTRDVQTAKAALTQQWKAWAAGSTPYLLEETEDDQALSLRNSFGRLYGLLASEKLQVRVLPDDAFGLVHGKAGVITQQNGTKTSFMGSANDTASAWRANYELIWEDPSPEAVRWTQNEFDALWNHPAAVKLSEAVVQEIGRLGRRSVLSAEQWRTDPQPASAVIEAPVFRKDLGLWQHQKYFVKKAFSDHTGPLKKARYVLADQVGLGKTVQLALTAQLIALTGEKPVLILCPKTLVWQWQDELKELLDLPTAVWDGKRWVDEAREEHAAIGAEGIRRCPRRVGIVSTGLLTMATEAREQLLKMEYDCIILDEAHKARRKNLNPNRDHHAAEPNNLMDFMLKIAPRTRSLLLATATPVQIRPVEAYDLLMILNNGDESVLGNGSSIWRRHGADTLRLVMGQDPLPQDASRRWELITNPLPTASDLNVTASLANSAARDVTTLRKTLSLPETLTTLTGSDYLRLSPPEQSRVGRMFNGFMQYQNPYIRRIIRRTREQMETTIDPETHEPFLKRIGVRLYGEAASESIHLPVYLESAYQHAEQFCALVGRRQRSAGFLRTLVLRRLGSSLAAGINTASRFLGEAPLLGLEESPEEAFESDEEGESTPVELSAFAQGLHNDERQELHLMLQDLRAYTDADPKFEHVLRYLTKEGWLELGCIIFSQYRDSLSGLAEYLSKAFPQEPMALYSGSSSSGLLRGGVFRRASRERIKAMVRAGELRLLLGTDAASEGLNLQRLGTLINLDLPWNPTRLEQRKGRIQRIGQQREEVWVYNMRYRGSVEDRVHELLSSRLSEIYSLFGQLPDVLEDVWVHAALGELEQARQVINEIPRQHPFQVRNATVEHVDWESCGTVLSESDRRRILLKGW